MELQPDLSKISALELRGEIERWETRRNALLAAFPYLEDGSASLTAQYAGGPEWDKLAEANSQIAKLKLELITRDQLETAVPVPEKVPANDRESFVMPILGKRGWSILDWANNSEVDYHTASDYLKGKTAPYKSTLKKLADSLGVDVQELPS